jgi:hypothetical protein
VCRLITCRNDLDAMPILLQTTLLLICSLPVRATNGGPSSIWPDLEA